MLCDLGFVEFVEVEEEIRGSEFETKSWEEVEVNPANDAADDKFVSTSTKSDWYGFMPSLNKIRSKGWAGLEIIELM